jgi:hypothetical protein
LRVATGRREYGEGGPGLEWSLMGRASTRDKGSTRLNAVSIFMGVAIGCWALPMSKWECGPDRIVLEKGDWRALQPEPGPRELLNIENCALVMTAICRVRKG